MTEPHVSDAPNDETEAPKLGRPTAYKAEYAQQAEVACKAGFTDKELADLFGVSTQTLNAWKKQHPAFLDAIKTGKEEADERVQRSLYHRAVGYSFDSVKIFPPKVWNDGEEVKFGEPVVVPYVEHVPPDTTACIFWLKNRRKTEWRDRHELTGPDGGAIQINQVSDLELARRVLFDLEQAERAKKDKP